jgi:hypothetical protein
LLKKDSSASLDMEEFGQISGDSALPRPSVEPPAEPSVEPLAEASEPSAETSSEPSARHHIPISNVNIQAIPHKREISERETHLWLSLEVVADVDLEGGRIAQADKPLEVIILLDTSSVPSSFLICLS